MFRCADNFDKLNGGVENARLTVSLQLPFTAHQIFGACDWPKATIPFECQAAASRADPNV